MLRFQREAEVLASLNHPNIAHIYGIEDCTLVMELVAGESPKGPLPFEDAWNIALQIASALEYAHEKGVIHVMRKNWIRRYAAYFARPYS
jgi:serine/threonine-protein kinase